MHFLLHSLCFKSTFVAVFLSNRFCGIFWAMLFPVVFFKMYKKRLNFLASKSNHISTKKKKHELSHTFLCSPLILYILQLHFGCNNFCGILQLHFFYSLFYRHFFCFQLNLKFVEKSKWYSAILKWLSQQKTVINAEKSIWFRNSFQQCTFQKGKKKCMKILCLSVFFFPPIYLQLFPF